MSRTTKEHSKQTFGDGVHYFYLEYRCINKPLKGFDVCAGCVEKQDKWKTQSSLKFNHGKINEPITDSSHIYGSKWYLDHIKKYGTPLPDIEEFAIQYKREARGEYYMFDDYPGVEEYKVGEPIDNQEGMPPKKKALGTDSIISSLTAVTDAMKVRKRRPKVAIPLESSDTYTESLDSFLIVKDAGSPVEELPQAPTTVEVVPKKRGRKPQAKEPQSKGEKVEKEVKRRPREKKVESVPVAIPIVPERKHLETCIATHIEKEMEKLDISDYRIVYVKLSSFEHNGVKYYIHHDKGKLYRQNNDRSVGEYVGRWYKEMEEIDRDVPDSDTD